MIFRLEMDRHYKYRLAYCKYIERLAFAFTGPITKKLIQSLFSLVADPIAIVRIGSCKAIGTIIHHNACSKVSLLKKN